MNSIQKENGSMFKRHGTFQRIVIGGSVLEYLAPSPMTDDSVGIYRVTIAPKSPGAGLHYHHRITETFEIHEGVLSMMLDGQKIDARKGDFVLVKPQSIHGFANESDEQVIFTLTFTPALAREGFFEGLAELFTNHRMNDSVAVRALMEKYDQVPVEGPEGWTKDI